MSMILLQDFEDHYLNLISASGHPQSLGVDGQGTKEKSTPAHHHGPPACGWSDSLRSCLALHECLAEESLAKSFPFLLLFKYIKNILPSHISHTVKINGGEG